MKIVARFADQKMRTALEERGHTVVDISPTATTQEVIERIIGCNAVLFTGSALTGDDEENFLFGVSVALDKDVVLICGEYEDYWTEVPAVRIFDSFDTFLEKAERGIL